MTQDKAIVSHMGLDDRDITVIHSIYRLAANLQARFQLVDAIDSVTPDIVLVNADAETVVSAWKVYSSNHKLVVPVMVTSKDTSFGDAITVKRPINVKKFVETLESIGSTDSVESTQALDAAQAPKILVVDDSFPVRKFMEHKLPEIASQAVIVEFAQDGEEALEKVAKVVYQLVFLDVMMPGIDGYKVCKEIKSKYSFPVIMLTSKKSPFDKVRGSMSGCDAYITKPPQDERIKKILDKYLFAQDVAGSGLSTSAKLVQV